MESKALPRFLVVLSLFVLLSAFSVNMQTTSAQNGTTTSDWTYMVYMSGDSSLSSNVGDDLNEMKEVGSSDDLNIIVLVDQSTSVDTQLLRVMAAGSESLPLSSVNATWGNELNLGRPQTLVDFVTWTVANYPADHYVLDLWGHGTGWSGVCPDKDDFLEPTELRSAMSSIASAGIHLDIVSIDACQMGMVETVYELRQGAEFAIVSEKDVPVSGWPYAEVLAILADEPTISPTDFGIALIDEYMDWGLMHSRYTLTLALIDLGSMEALVNAIDAYSSEASNTVGYFNYELITARMATEEYDGSYQYDLWHLLENINSHTEYKRLETLSKDVLVALDAAVVYERHWTNTLDEPAYNANGLSVYFPPNAPPSAYLTTSLGQDTAWDEFLADMAPYFSNLVKSERPLNLTAVSVDTDSDGLADLFEMSVFVPSFQASSFELEVYGPDGSLAFEYSSGSGGQINIPYTPEALGAYSAAFYLWEDGSLVNYSYVDSDLNKEGWSTVSGRVTSNIGRGLKWTQIKLLEADGSIIGSTVTDFDGHFILTVKVPTDTEGVNLTLSCGLGSRQQNATLQQLFGTNEQDFELETSHLSVLWLACLTVVLNVSALVILILWFLGGRVTGPHSREEDNRWEDHPSSGEEQHLSEVPEEPYSERPELHTDKNKTF